VTGGAEYSCPIKKEWPGQETPLLLSSYSCFGGRQITSALVWRRGGRREEEGGINIIEHSLL